MWNVPRPGPDDTDEKMKLAWSYLQVVDHGDIHSLLRTAGGATEIVPENTPCKLQRAAVLAIVKGPQLQIRT